jgi:DNA-binding NtrC family response regulator
MSKDKKIRILLADDEPIVHQTISDYLRDAGHEVDDVYDGASALQNIEETDYALVLLDVRMPGMDGLAVLNQAQEIRPDMSIVIITGHGNMEMVIQALRLGATDFLAKPIELLQLDAVLEKATQVRNLKQQERKLRQTIAVMQGDNETDLPFVGDSQDAEHVRVQIDQAIEMQCDRVLITGETGTGKEVVARNLHFTSGSEDRPFIAVCCPALPNSLVESELFGHTKGSFTGATGDRAGYLELADGGTLYLDEIADLSLAIQAKLLRVFESWTFRRVGGSDEIHVNLNVIASTNTPLEELIEQGKFREDLYYRLNVYQINLTPLRERPEDIVPLADHFLSKFAASRRGIEFTGFSHGAREILLNYEYPGNARELRNIVERAAILCRSGEIEAVHLNIPSSRPVEKSTRPPQRKPSGQREAILQALENAKWNRRLAAKALGMPYSTLRYQIHKFGIS